MGTSKNRLFFPVPLQFLAFQATKHAFQIKTSLILLFILLFPLPLFPISLTGPVHYWETLEGDPVELAFRMTEEMSDEQALAQTFMLAWVGAEPSPLILEWIRHRNIGGGKIFGWNTDNTLRLAQTVGELQSASLATQFGIPLFVATDQEGGMVRHVRGATSQTPGNMAIGASGRPIDAYRSGYFIGRELALLGINMNFAPTVDLHTNRHSTIIGPRSFGDDPVNVAILGAAFARGHRETGVIATAKHFPGHGDTALDSHGILPRITAPFEVLWDRELIPYRMLIREGIPAVMSGHLAFPNTPGGETPASLSPWFLKDVLRGKLNFDGVIITDDLMMHGALDYTRSLPIAARMALQAGNDIIMLSITPHLNDAVWTYLLSTMQTDPAFRERVRDACRRILTLKLQHLQGQGKVPFIPDLERVATELRLPESDSFFLSLAARSVTTINGEDLFPLTPENSGSVLLAGNFVEFINAGRRAFPGSASFHLGRGAAALAAYIRNADTVIFCLSNIAGLRVLQEARRLVNMDDKNIIVFSILNPVHLEELYWVDGAVVVYSYAPVSFNAGFSAILGRIPGEGRLPFSINGN